MNAGKPDKAEKPAEKKAESKTESGAKSKRASVPARGKIYDSVLDTIGGTPLVRLPRIKQKYKLEGDIFAKLEYFNPLSSIKDRVALAMVETAEAAGKITPGKTTLAEATAGNTAHSLAFVAAAKGYKLVLYMPETVPFERRKVLLLLGAELVLTPGNHGMKGAVEALKNAVAKAPEGAIHVFNVFEDKAGARIHAETTAEEIWADTNGKVDIVVVGVGSGATVTGLSTALRKKKPGIKIYAIEPEEAAVLSGMKVPVQHEIPGIGAGFVPPALDTKSFDGILQVHSNRAHEMGRELAKIEGIPGGVSSGASLAAAIDIAQQPENKDKMVVMIVSSCAERYLSTHMFNKTQ